VDVAWKFACGERIPGRTFSDTLEAAAGATPDVDEEGDEYADAMRAGVSAICALKAVKDSTAKSAVDAAMAALEAVGSFEDHMGNGEAAEEQWQERALKLVESWGARPIIRDMFAVLGDDPPVCFPWPKRQTMSRILIEIKTRPFAR
jgi:hypothetical protein